MPARRGRPRREVPPCRFCRKQFRRSEHLERHERTHTREQPFLCSCGRRFSRRDLLSRHHRISHADENTHHVEAENRDSVGILGQSGFEASENTQLPSDDHLGGEPHALPSEVQDSEPPSHHVSSVIAESQVFQANAFGQESDWTSQDPNMGFQRPFEDPLTQDLLTGMDGFDFDSLWDDTQFLNPFSPAGALGSGQLENGGTLSPMSPEFQYREHPPNPQDQSSRPEAQGESGIASRLPSMEPERPEVMPLHVNAAHGPGPRRDSQQAQTLRQVHPIRPWKISPEQHSHLLKKFADTHGYFRGFAIHMPFLHAVSFSVASISLELIFSMCAVGALHRFPPDMGYQLYADAQALICWRMRDRSRPVLDRLANYSHERAGTLSTSITGPHSSASSAVDISRMEREGEGDTLQLLQAMIVLMAMASWGNPGLTQDALSMASQVAMLARELKISVPEVVRPSNQTWSDGIKHEERRRTLFAAYELLNLQSVAFNVPPLLLNHEVTINIPGCASSWQAQDAAEWSSLRDTYMTPGPFQEKLNELLSGKQIHLEAAISSFGNHVLIHGLLQQVFLSRNAAGCLPDADGALCDSIVDKMQHSLRAWQESWEATYESTTDPSSPKGPLGFNSTAILRLAYIRLSANFGPCLKLLFAREPWEIVEASFSERAIKAEDRSPRLDRAVLQCIHALSIPVRLGIAFVAQTQTMNWGVEHALCNLECAFLLAQWLLVISECVEASGVEALRADERRLVDVVVGLMRETEFGDSFDQDSPSRAIQIRTLATSTMYSWAQIYRGSYVFDIVGLIGRGLEALAESMG